jgi:hypothetical protein
MLHFLAFQLLLFCSINSSSNKIYFYRWVVRLLDIIKQHAVLGEHRRIEFASIFCTTVLHNYLLHSFVLHFPFLACEWILKSGIIAGIHNQLTHFAKFAFSWNSKERGIKKGVVFPQIFFSLISKHKKYYFYHNLI